MNFRIGQGYDVHQLATGHELCLGGIIIPHKYGTVGHSDADPLLHAICDAMLGALALRDIGFHFPDNDKDYKNIDSKILLKDVLIKIKAKGYKVNNIDTTICLQQPKVKDYISEMQEVIANILDLDINAVSIKATTTEKLGFVGREEGIEAHAIVLLVQN